MPRENDLRAQEHGIVHKTWNAHPEAILSGIADRPTFDSPQFGEKIETRLHEGIPSTGDGTSRNTRILVRHVDGSPALSFRVRLAVHDSVQPVVSLPQPRWSSVGFCWSLAVRPV
jgi:hypothetical protein